LKESKVTAKFWSEKTPDLDKDKFQMLWREHSDRVHIDLISKWLPGKTFNKVFKTDLFDEYVCTGLYPFLAAKSKAVYGIDLSEPIAKNSRLKYPDMSTLQANILSLPFAENVFDLIVSNSTIDHFQHLDNIVESLNELYRTLAKDGIMILTIDNLDNPIVAFRNRLPYPFLYRAGIVPYYVGVTLGLKKLLEILEQTGFEILDKCFIMHCPRIFCVLIAEYLKKNASRKGQLRFLRALKMFERLSTSPVSPLTGHFIAVKLAKK
jgi:SAM-dependent methyltransferase